MSDLIRRKDVLGACIEEAQKVRRYQFGQIWELNYYEIKEAINSIPPAEPKVGRWIDAGWDGEKCSLCGWNIDDTYYVQQFNFCPNCGARMEGNK